MDGIRLDPIGCSSNSKNSQNSPCNSSIYRTKQTHTKLRNMTQAMKQAMKFEHLVELRLPTLHADAVKALANATEVTAFAAAATTDSSESQAVSTDGWDTVFAIRVEDVNRILEQAGGLPTKFSKEGTDEELGLSYKLNGEFGAWRISSGSNKLIHMKLPIKNGAFELGAKKYDLTGATVEIEVELILDPPAPPKELPPNAPPDGTKHKLKINTGSSDSNPHPVTFQRIEGIPNNPGQSIIYIIGGSLATWLIENSHAVTNFFAEINLNNQLDKNDGYQWLRPTYSTYAYAAGLKSQDDVLAVLSMTEERDPPTGSPSPSATTIPRGEKAGFLISKTRFLEKMLLPNLPSLFLAGSNPKFKLDGEAGMILNDGILEMSSVHYGAIDYYPKMDVFEVAFNDGKLRIHAEMSVQISPGIVSYITVTKYKGINLVTKDGKQTLKIIDTDDPRDKSDHYTKVDPGLEIAGAVLAIVGALVGVIVGAIFKTAQAIILGIVIAIIFGLTEVTVRLISAITSEVGRMLEGATLDKLKDAAFNTIKWTGSDVFELTHASFEDCIQLAGNPHFKFT